MSTKGTSTETADTASPPPEAAPEVFGRYAALLRELGIEDSPNPVLAASEVGGNAAVQTVVALQGQVLALLAEGENDASDPWVCPAMFTHLGVDAFGRRIGFVRDLSPSVAAVLGGLAPVDAGEAFIGAYYVLGSLQSTIIRRSVVEALTRATRAGDAPQQ